MSDLEELLEKNKNWAAAIKAEDPEFFYALAQQHTPRYLWVGCSDSRVPSTQLVGLLPGELFVHRNVANVVADTDFNFLSVLQFAVDVLKVSYIIVCGHYGCGGVQAAAVGTLPRGPIASWLRHVQDVMRRHEDYLSGIEDGTCRFERMCELNVIEQVLNVSQTDIVQSAWERGQRLAIHGWIYGIEDGLLRDLHIRIRNQEEQGAAYESAVRDVTSQKSRAGVS